MRNGVPYQSKSEKAEQLRHLAVNLYLESEKVSEIARRTGRSRQWVHTTLNRYRAEGRDGLISRSRAPHQVHNRTLPEIEAAAVRIRETILSGTDPILRYAGVGARVIRSELNRMGVTAPSPRTINRILQRHGVQRPRRRQEERKLPKDYPWPCVEQANVLHLFDFVTRMIKGGSRFYGYHLLDQGRRWPYLEAHPRKNSTLVSQFLVNAWQRIGLPQGLQMDNDIVWRGSSSGARTFSHIVRLCLAVGIEVIFTPTYTPEANPIIESFNGVWASNFWHRRIFADLDQVQQELLHFQTYYRHRHPLAEFQERKAVELAPDFRPTRLSEDFDQHRMERIPLTAGLIHFIRFVDAKAIFCILNERWILPDNLANKTIRATIDTNNQQLLIYHQHTTQHAPKLVHTWDYPVGETVQPLEPVFVRPKPRFWPAPSHSVDC
jgi:transposase InsO family protein